MHMTEMIDARFKSEKTERDDLLSTLLNASDKLEDGGLTTDELIGALISSFVVVTWTDVIEGNIFVFLLAGHEVQHSTF
jgi:hypothetical protein